MKVALLVAQITQDGLRTHEMYVLLILTLPPSQVARQLDDLNLSNYTSKLKIPRLPLMSRPQSHLVQLYVSENCLENESSISQSILCLVFFLIYFIQKLVHVSLVQQMMGQILHLSRPIKVQFRRGLHSTEEAFLLPNQQPRVRIPALPRFFLITA